MLDLWPVHFNSIGEVLASGEDPRRDHSGGV